MINKNKIETTRLILCEIVEQDVELIVRWRRDPDVYKYFRSPHALTYEEHMRWYREKYLDDKTQMHFIARDKRTEKPVGVFSVRKHLEPNDCVEVSYLVDSDEQGNGYAQEAVLGMMRYAKEEWRAQKAIAEIHEANFPSQKLIEKLDFKQVDKNDSFLIYERLLCYT